MLVTTELATLDLLSFFDLTAEESIEMVDSDDDGHFFRYNGMVFDLSEFMRFDRSDEGWDGYLGSSAFHCWLVRFTDDDEIVFGERLSRG